MQNESPELPAIAPKTPEALKMPTPDILDTSPQFAPLVPENMPQASQMSDRPVLRPAQRVTLEEVAPPPPEVNLDDLRQEAAIPDDLSAPVAPPKEEASAPEAASREIVTEAEEMLSFAPQQSARPTKRPAAPPQPEVPAPEPEPLPEPELEADVTQEPSGIVETNATAIDAAISEALNEESKAQIIKELPSSERNEINSIIQKIMKNCWAVRPGFSTSYVNIVVRITFKPDGKVNNLALVSFSGGEESAAKAAFQSAKSAIYRCQKSGFPLQNWDYRHWSEYEFEFDPSRMRSR